MPVAVSWSAVPLAREGAVGVTSIELSVAAVTVRAVDPVTPPKAADRVAAPGATAVARPWVPAAFETVAIEASELDQLTWAVRSCLVLSEKIPIAASWIAL